MLRMYILCTTGFPVRKSSLHNSKCSTVQHACKNEKLFLYLPFNSPGYRIFFFSLQINKQLSFQASVEFLSSSLPVDGSCRDIPAGSTLGSTVASCSDW